MKCPECGKWNRAGLPHCAYCGTELPDEIRLVISNPETLYGEEGVPSR